MLDDEAKPHSVAKIRIFIRNQFDSPEIQQISGET